MPNILTDAQIEQFVADGYTMLPGAFPAEAADRIRARLWDELTPLGPQENDPATWTQPVVHIKKSYSDGPFAEAWTDKLHAAFDDLMGEGRWRKQKYGLGWWPVAFPGFDAKPWTPPQAGWHVDGIQFHHHVHSADQGLLPLFIFSPIEAGDGGTALSIGSHKITARLLAEAEPDGMDVHDLARAVASHERSHVVEMTGQPGDVALVHPFTLHARSPNTGERVRFICNPCIPLYEPLNLSRAAVSEYSPVERAVVAALA